MTIRWSSGVLNKLVSPGYTGFTQATIQDVSGDHPEAQHWLANFFLNSALRGRYKERMQQLVLGFLRRSHHAFIAYHDARKATLDYLQDNDPHHANIRPYYEAVALWENYVLQVSMAIDLYNHISKPDKAFEKNDGSKEQRIYSIANHVKHVGGCVSSGQCTEEDTLPLWLTNDGLSSFGVSASYDEASEVLRDIAKLADLLQDPRGVAEKLTSGEL
jgi:hypothetical protein